MNRSFDINLDYNAYMVLRVNRYDIYKIADEIAPFPIEHIIDIAEDIDLLNEWHSRNVRKYAVDMLARRGFFITDPADGSRLKVGATYTFDDFQTIFFFFAQACRIGIVASDLATGFPLSTIILFDAKIIIHLTESFWGLGERHFKSLAERGDGTIHERAADCDICLVAGDANFAHHAWNELSSLQEIADLGFDRTTKLVIVHEPLGPVNAILGSGYQVVRKVAKAQLPEVNQTSALTFCSTGIYIDRRLAERITTFADAHLSPFAAETKRKAQDHPGRTLWVSVRTRNRTISAQKDVLAKLIENYLRAGDDRMVIIDGHSLPFDHHHDAPYIQEINNSIVHDDIVEADQIVDLVKATLPDAVIVQFAGRRIHEAIAVGRHVGFYFCHHGTVQHKLGWFSDVPGLVHCNREILQILPAQWVRQQSEVATLPVYMPVDLIDESDQDQDMGDLHRHLHHDNYRITNITGASRLIAQFAEEVQAINQN